MIILQKYDVYYKTAVEYWIYQPQYCSVNRLTLTLPVALYKCVYVMLCCVGRLQLMWNQTANYRVKQL